MNKRVEKNFFLIQGPAFIIPSRRKCRTEAARAYASHERWLFDCEDIIYNANGQELCDSIEKLADVLVELGVLKELNGGFFPDWTHAGSIDDVEQAVRGKLA